MAKFKDQIQTNPTRCSRCQPQIKLKVLTTAINSKWFYAEIARINMHIYQFVFGRWLALYSTRILVLKIKRPQQRLRLQWRDYDDHDEGSSTTSQKSCEERRMIWIQKLGSRSKVVVNVSSMFDRKCGQDQALLLVLKIKLISKSRSKFEYAHR